MSIFKFEITSNGFILRTYFSDTEQQGIKWCGRYCSQFQRKVSNQQMKLLIYKREKQQNRWEYKGKPYEYDRTLVKKPLTKKPTIDEEKN